MATRASTHRICVGNPGEDDFNTLVIDGIELVIPLEMDLYDLHVQGRPPLKDQRTDGDGLIKQPVPIGATSAILEVRGRTLKLQFGALNPAWDTPDEGVRGAQARLHNLGFNVGPDDGELGRRTHAAIAMFQHEQGMTIDGELTEELANALRDAHGS
jgi:hypothetical protein